jgi:antitoxin CptB
MDAQRRMLRLRAWRRGFREMDLLMGHFADAHVEAMPAAELVQFEQLLAAPDQDVFAWIIGLQPPPAEMDGSVLRQLRAFRDTAHTHWSPGGAA